MHGQGEQQVWNNFLNLVFSLCLCECFCLNFCVFDVGPVSLEIMNDLFFVVFGILCGFVCVALFVFCFFF